MNRTVIVGRLTKDPDLRYTQNGHAVANFTVAVNRPFKNQQGENEADFINCTAWREQAENLAKYQGKGNRIGIDGRIETSSFDGQDGKKVFTTKVLAESVQFLEPKKQQNQSKQEQHPMSQEQGVEKVEIDEKDLPF